MSTKRVLILSNTFPGHVYDKTGVNEQAFFNSIPPTIRVHLELGFLGIPYIPKEPSAFPKRSLKVLLCRRKSRPEIVRGPETECSLNTPSQKSNAFVWSRMSHAIPFSTLPIALCSSLVDYGIDIWRGFPKFQHQIITMAIAMTI